MRQIFPFEEEPTLWDDMVLITAMVLDGLVAHADEAISEVHEQHFNPEGVPWFDTVQGELQHQEIERMKGWATDGGYASSYPAAGADESGFTTWSLPPWGTPPGPGFYNRWHWPSMKHVAFPDATQICGINVVEPGNAYPFCVGATESQQEFLDWNAHIQRQFTAEQEAALRRYLDQVDPSLYAAEFPPEEPCGAVGGKGDGDDVEHVCRCIKRQGHTDSPTREFRNHGCYCGASYRLGTYPEET